jgi:hypothetical protein
LHRELALFPLLFPCFSCFRALHLPRRELEILLEELKSEIFTQTFPGNVLTHSLRPCHHSAAPRVVVFGLEMPPNRPLPVAPCRTVSSPNLARSTMGAFCALHSGALEKCQRSFPTRNATLARGAASVGAFRHHYEHSVHEVHFS